MNLPDLKKLVIRGESDTLEFKKSTGQRKEALRTLCAMLNGRGGVVLFGITDDGEIKGQQVSTGTMEDIAEELYRLEPPAFTDIERIEIGDEKEVIAVRVSAVGGPYTYDGRSYMREGPTTRIMPQPRYERLLLEKMHAAHRWENQPAIGVTLEDLDRAEITRSVEEAIRRQRLEDPGTREPVELLTGMGLIRDGQLLNAAVVLFAKAEKLLPNYPQCLIRLA